MGNVTPVLQFFVPTQHRTYDSCRLDVLFILAWDVAVRRGDRQNSHVAAAPAPQPVLGVALGPLACASRGARPPSPSQPQRSAQKLSQPNLTLNNEKKLCLPPLRTDTSHPFYFVNPSDLRRIRNCRYCQYVVEVIL